MSQRWSLSLVLTATLVDKNTKSTKHPNLTQLQNMIDLDVVEERKRRVICDCRGCCGLPPETPNDSSQNTDVVKKPSKIGEPKKKPPNPDGPDNCEEEDRENPKPCRLKKGILFLGHVLPQPSLRKRSKFSGCLKIHIRAIFLANICSACILPIGLVIAAFVSELFSQSVIRWTLEFREYDSSRAITEFFLSFSDPFAFIREALPAWLIACTTAMINYIGNVIYLENPQSFHASTS